MNVSWSRSAAGRTSPSARSRGLRAATAFVVGTSLAALGAWSAPATAASSANVYVIHGLVGQTVDVVVDDKVVGAAAKPKSIVGPLKLDAGAHTVVLRQDGKDVANSQFNVKGGQSVDVIAHRQSDASRAPELTAFRNDISSVAPGKLRLAVAHTAAAPPADIRVDGAVLFRNVANAESLTLTVPAKTYTVDIVPTATDGEPILGPVDLPLQAGTLTRVFAIGDVATGNMDAVVHSLPVKVSGAAKPGSVKTGDGGQAAQAFTDGGVSLPVMGGIALIALVLAGGGVLAAGGQQSQSGSRDRL